jgi:hypothetical protein
MTEPQVIELWRCGYTAKCSAQGYRSTLAMPRERAVRWAESDRPKLPAR